MLKSSTLKILLISLAVCAPWSARAQSTSNLVSEAELVSDADFDEANISGRVWTANIESCRDLLDDDEELEFEWTLASSYSDSDLRYAIKLERPDGECDTTSADQENEEECEFIATNQAVGSGTVYSVSVRPSRILGMSSPDDCFTEQDGAYDMIMVLPLVLDSTDDDSHEPDVIRLRLDTERPDPPPGTPEVQAGESRFEVDWDEATEADEYKIYVSSTQLNAGALPESLVGADSATVSDSTSGTYSGGISAGETYYVAVVAVDGAGNESVLSSVATVVAQPSEDFWEVYRSRGGAESGGYCASAGAGSTGASVVVSLLLVLGLVRRRRTA